MKNKLFVTLLGYFATALPFATLHAQAENLLALGTHAYLPNSKTMRAEPETHSYKAYVGVYVRAKVMRTFMDVFSDATAVQWHLSDNQYLASFKREGRLCKALFSTQGELIYVIRYGTEKTLPRDVRRLIQSSYPAYSIGVVAEVAQDGNTRWIANLQNTDHLVVVQVLDGALEELHSYNTHF